MDNTNDNFFQVSVKALFFDEQNKLMMLQEADGRWEPAGGRVQKGEDLLECLQRECFEETGLTCEVLEARPSIAYSTIDGSGRPRIMLFYRVKFSSLDFKPSNECIDVKFFTKEEIRNLNKAPQIEKLVDFL